MNEIIDVEAVDVNDSEACKINNEEQRNESSSIKGVIKSALDRTPGLGQWNKLPDDSKVS